MSLEDQIKEATANQDWAKVAELAAQLAKPEEVAPKKKGRKMTNKTPTSPKVVDHQKWHAENLYRPVSVPNRPNKFVPEEFKDTKRYRVPNDPKFGEFAGKVFPNEEAYLREAVYSTTYRRKPPTAKKVTVVCSLCHKSVKLFESEITDRSGKYKCDACLSGGRGVVQEDDD